jgi:hypothetical protein
MKPVQNTANARLVLEYRGFPEDVPGASLPRFKKLLFDRSLDNVVRCELSEDVFTVATPPKPKPGQPVSLDPNDADTREVVKLKVELTGHENRIQNVTAAANNWAHAAGVEIYEVEAERLPPREYWIPSYAEAKPPPRPLPPNGDGVVLVNDLC